MRPCVDYHPLKGHSFSFHVSLAACTRISQAGRLQLQPEPATMDSARLCLARRRPATSPSGPLHQALRKTRTEKLMLRIYFYMFMDPNSNQDWRVFSGPETSVATSSCLFLGPGHDVLSSRAETLRTCCQAEGQKLQGGLVWILSNDCGNLRSYFKVLSTNRLKLVCKTRISPSCPRPVPE